MDKYGLYFLAITPPTSISEKIQQIRLFIYNQYGCKQALKAPPHITLHMPFRFPLNKEDKLLTTLSAFKFEKEIDIQLNNFAVFSLKVIFIDVIKNTEIEMLYHTLKSYLKTNLNIFNEADNMRSFHPHITVAFRDVKKHQSNEILNNIQKQFRIQDTFTTQQMVVLKHNTHYWDVYTTVNLK